MGVEDYIQLLKHNDEKNETDERELKSYVEELECRIKDMGEAFLHLQAKIRKLEDEKQAIEEKFNTFVRKQQEESFSRITTSRWAPIEDCRVIRGLDRLKKKTRNWAKTVSLNDINAIMKSLDGSKHAALKDELDHVTLRLLLPPAATASEKEKVLRDHTETSMTLMSDLQAAGFLEGAAQYLISDEARANCEAKLRAIYLEAATISYNLWTRKTFLKCTTFKGLNYRGFHPDDKHIIPHSSVDFESHEDQLVGKAISIMVHPLLEAYGSDEGKDYDQGRVWAPAEVWLNSSRKPSVG
ncbi:hypothetical protein DID88_001920 [Monilinia fructigena]|uniref:Uncharacterized protein n=1 Tax=Monilinia fructigena TaxID=38457 RepID=A0A395IX49_9HELO|nr:hypothetical protein DID88_001920 [Monilinia fructigena]